jgi:hypothetical protein
MPTLKEFEDALREQGMQMALAILERLRERDRAVRSVARARRVTGRKMTPDLARSILELHASTNLTQQEIAFRLGVNQGRVNEVIKHGKWLSGDPDAPEALARDEALARLQRGPRRPSLATRRREGRSRESERSRADRPRQETNQLSFGDL